VDLNGQPALAAGGYSSCIRNTGDSRAACAGRSASWTLADLVSQWNDDRCLRHQSGPGVSTGARRRWKMGFRNGMQAAEAAALIA
jgi:hypothetical protein